MYLLYELCIQSAEKIEIIFNHAVFYCTEYEHYKHTQNSLALMHSVQLVQNIIRVNYVFHSVLTAEINNLE